MADPVVRQDLSRDASGEPLHVDVYADSCGEYTLRYDGQKTYRGSTLTATGWLECPDPMALLEFLGRDLEPRKSRLLAVACCGRYLPEVPDRRCRDGLQTAERYADGLVGDPERLKARQATRAAAVAYAGCRPQDGDVPWLLAREIRQALDRQVHATIAVSGCLAVARSLAATAAFAAERAWHAQLVGHLFGNPFRPYPAPASWPALVVDLAQQLYAGADVRLVLHDALLDAGHAELAEHFRAGEWHPKGCWVVDMLTGRV